MFQRNYSEFLFFVCCTRPYFWITIIEETLDTVSADSQIAKCFHQTQKLSGGSAVFWPKDLGLVLLNSKLFKFSGGIKHGVTWPNIKKVTVVNFLIILVLLIGLVQLKGCHLSHVGILDGEVASLLFKKSIFFSHICSVAFETSLFLCSNGSLHPPIIDIFCHW